MSNDETSNNHDVCNLVNCKWNRKLLTSYLAIMFPYMITSLISLTLIRLWTGKLAFTLTYGIFLIIFFVFIRTKILCSHCPYYKEKRFLDPLPKIWKFNPKPMNKMGVIITSIGMVFFLIFPAVSLAYVLWYIIEKLESTITWQIVIYSIFLVLTILFALFYVLKLTSNFCLKCINFSCPMNRVPKDVISKYLEVNIEMKNIYQKAGFAFD